MKEYTKLLAEADQRTPKMQQIQLENEAFLRSMLKIDPLLVTEALEGLSDASENMCPISRIVVSMAVLRVRELVMEEVEEQARKE